MDKVKNTPAKWIAFFCSLTGDSKPADWKWRGKYMFGDVAYRMYVNTVVGRRMCIAEKNGFHSITSITEIPSRKKRIS